MDYKSTLNLPVTDFPMRAKLNEREPFIYKKWLEIRLDEEILKQRSPDKRFTLHDGPPYANGNIHIGHALNKILKDIIVRYKNMMGYYSHYVPGWDCHGLPIEQKVREKLGSKAFDKTPLEIRTLCAEYAHKWVNTQSGQFQRLGIGGDFAHPYKTLIPEYEVGILKAFRALVENDLIYRGRKPVFWCIGCGTALADAEVEYENHTSDSIYVRFPVLNPEKIRDFKEKKASIVIWTTTPWTLPANVAVSLHPDFDYVAARTKSGDAFIVAHYLLQDFLGKCELGEAEIIGRWKGAELEGLECAHPLLEKKSIVILGTHVTLEQGTGCVHTAPGHGYEDYLMLLKYNLPMVMPVDDNGCFTEEFPLMKGVLVWVANGRIIEKLREDGLLLHSEKVEHSYPHCWRCHKPIIFRATEQWFMSVDKNEVRQRMLRAIDEVQWIPSWGRDRIYNMVVMRPDWCLSRQRKWGVPIPAVKCQKCGMDILDLKIIDRFIEQVKEKGTDAWFSEPDESVIPEGFQCPECKGNAFKKNTDTLDVWFDSGSSHVAVCEQRKDLGSPADLYLEGSDQHRGWFQSSLLVGIGARNHAPYKAVLTHGFMLDAKGEAMSKSRGNIIAPEKIIEKLGADVLRLWVSSEDYREDVRISHEILERISDAYRRIRNTFRFLLGNLGDFKPERDSLDYSRLQEFDQWALNKLADITKRVLRAYENYEFHKIYHLIHTFCVVDMSALYLDIVKDRLYVEGKTSPERRSCQTVLYHVADTLLRLLAPILPFTMEEVYQSLLVSTGKSGSNPLSDDKPISDSIHRQRFPEIPDEWINPHLQQKWERLLEIRDLVVRALEDARRNKIIGHSLDAIVTITTTSEETNKFSGIYSDFLADFCIVSHIEINKVDRFGEALKAMEGHPEISISVEKAPWPKCSRCWKLHPEVNKDTEYPEICPRCVKVMKSYMSPQSGQ
ncbi:isoleucine--tRNA ligase [Candidatus Sumerlaeota bacterium]|nr:isoleucine--tRNA ligase [Candidatus Sumerlaeota bacterium]